MGVDVRCDWVWGCDQHATNLAEFRPATTTHPDGSYGTYWFCGAHYRELLSGTRT